MSDADSDHWEARLTTRLEQHGVSDPAETVARWKAYRERAIALNLADLRSQLAATKSKAAPPTDCDWTADADSAPPLDRLAATLSGTIHRRIGDVESRLQTSIRLAVDRLERHQSESDKSLAVLNERLPPAGQAQGRPDATRGLGAVFAYGAATAAVVVTLVLALSALLWPPGG